MTLTFDPEQPYVEMIMQLSDEKLKSFFDDLYENYYNDEDEGILYDDEG